MAEKKLIQNPQRYSKGEGTWKISASPKIKPLELPIGEEIGELKPLIKADGIIIKLTVGDPNTTTYLVSPQTLQDIQDSNHPHYTSGDSGKVKGAQMGKSIPVITLDASRLDELALQQDGENDKAGVRDATYIFEGEEIDGVPKLLIDQINYTLVPKDKRAEDTFELWNIQLAGDYSIERLVVETAQSGSKVDLEKLAKLMSGVNERVQILRDDFNIIKDVYYNGKIPPNSSFTTITKLVEDDTTPDAEKGIQDEQVVFKFGGTTAVQSTPLTTEASTPVPVTQPANPPVNTEPTGSRGLFANIRARALELIRNRMETTPTVGGSGGSVRSNVR